jgi:cob(I)alamin adenosyltransferase
VCSGSPKTLFELCEDLSQAEVSRQLSVSTMRISRAIRGVTDVDSDLIATAKTVWGASFDEARTLTEWYARRIAFLGTEGVGGHLPTKEAS